MIRNDHNISASSKTKSPLSMESILIKTTGLYVATAYYVMNEVSYEPMLHLSSFNFWNPGDSLFMLITQTLLRSDQKKVLTSCEIKQKFANLNKKGIDRILCQLLSLKIGTITVNCLLLIHIKNCFSRSQKFKVNWARTSFLFWINPQSIIEKSKWAIKAWIVDWIKFQHLSTLSILWHLTYLQQS